MAIKLKAHRAGAEMHVEKKKYTADKAGIITVEDGDDAENHKAILLRLGARELNDAERAALPQEKGAPAPTPAPTPEPGK